MVEKVKATCKNIDNCQHYKDNPEGCIVHCELCKHIDRGAIECLDCCALFYDRGGDKCCFEEAEK